MFAGISLPFSVAEMLSTTMGFINIYGIWIVLGLGVLFQKVLFEKVHWIINKSVDTVMERKYNKSSSSQPPKYMDVQTIDMDWKVGKSGRMEGREIYGTEKRRV